MIHPSISIGSNQSPEYRFCVNISLLSGLLFQSSCRKVFCILTISKTGSQQQYIMSCRLHTKIISNIELIYSLTIRNIITMLVLSCQYILIATSCHFLVTSQGTRDIATVKKTLFLDAIESQQLASHVILKHGGWDLLFYHR